MSNVLFFIQKKKGKNRVIVNEFVLNIIRTLNEEEKTKEASFDGTQVGHADSHAYINNVAVLGALSHFEDSTRI